MVCPGLFGKTKKTNSFRENLYIRIHISYSYIGHLLLIKEHKQSTSNRLFRKHETGSKLS